MKLNRPHLLTLILGGVLASSAFAQPAKSNEPIVLNFVNADIDAVARTLAGLTGRNLVVDPRVKGTLNLSTDKPVSPAMAWDQFLATLRLQGFSLVVSNGLYKVVPEAEAKLQGGVVSEIPATSSLPSSSGPAGQVLTQIIKLNHENANNLVAVLRPLISPNNTINVNPGNNSLVITDYADNLQRLARIVAALDVANASDIEVVTLQHALATELAPLVMRLIESGGSSGTPNASGPNSPGDGSFKTTVVAEPRANSLIVRAANQARVAQVLSLIGKLDQPSSVLASGNIHVVYLKNAEASKLAITLRAALSSQVGGGTLSGTMGGGLGAINNPIGSVGAASGAAPNTAGAAPSFGSTGNMPTTGGQIQADTATNSLIITAPEPQYRQLRTVIDKLDQRRAQVLVESLIAEVNAEKLAQFGFQWQNIMGNNGGPLGVIGTNFDPAKIGGANIAQLSANPSLAAVGAGLNIASLQSVGGVYMLGALANFLQINGDANILSTPTLLTLDNEEAKIVVGQQVPFTTGSVVLNSAATTPFNTFERKDVGLTLRVRPQISETGTVRLAVYQEVSSIDKTTAASTGGPTTNKRSIESNVLVEDGSIVVLGGLLTDESNDNQSKVPGLGDIPFFGNLFKGQKRERIKKNLMVFLRPVVVRDAGQTDALSQSRYQQMMGVQQQAQPAPNPLLGIEGAAVMPGLPPKPNAPAR
jgi:general secretion pathway protein D